MLCIDGHCCTTSLMSRAAVAAELRERASPSLAGISQPGREEDAEKENGCSAASNTMPGPAVHNGMNT